MICRDVSKRWSAKQVSVKLQKFNQAVSKATKESAPKPEPPPTLPPESISKKENEQEDLKPPVVAEPKAEQSLLNGAIEMEIDEEAKEDEIMNEEDKVVSDIDVFFTPSIYFKTRLYVLQYPLRPCWLPYDLDERCEEVRVKPGSGEVEIDMSVHVDSNNYDSECSSKLKMTKQLHLNPIHAVVQLRCNISSPVSQKERTGLLLM